MASLATAFVRLLPDMDRFGPDLRRETERSASDVGGQAGRTFGQRMREAIRNTSFRGVFGSLRGEAGDADGSLRRLATGAQVLDRQINQLRSAVRETVQEFARTGDESLLRGLRKQQTQIRKLTSVRNLLPDDEQSEREGRRLGSRLAGGIASGVSGAASALGGVLTKVFSLPPQAQVGIGAGLLAAVAQAGPFIGAAVSGAALAGIGSGAVAAGVAAAFQDPRVKGAAQGLGEEAKRIFAGVGEDFAGDTVAAISRIRAELNRLGLREALAPAAAFIRPLTEGLLGLARNVMPGLRTAIAAAQQPIAAIAANLPRLGTAVGDLLTMFARHAEAGATALTLLFDVVVVGVKLIEAQIAVLATAFEWFDKLPGIFRGPLGIWIDEAKSSSEATGQWDTSLGGLREALTSAGGAMSTATTQAETWSAALRRMGGANLSAQQANIALEQSIDDATEAAKRNGDGINANIPKQRANRQALLNIAQAGVAARDAILEQTGSEQLAAAATERARAAFLSTARSMGVQRGEAIRLADSLFGIPRNVSTKSEFQPDNAGVERWKRTLSGIPRDIFISAHFDLINNREVALALRLGRLSAGGPVEGPGPLGVDSKLAMVAPGEHVWTHEEVQAAGGHGVIEAMRRAVLAGRRGTAAAATVSRDAGPGVDLSRLEALMATLIDRVERVAPGVAGALRGPGPTLRTAARAR